MKKGIVRSYSTHRKDEKKRYYLVGVRIEENMILKWVLSKEALRIWTGFIWFKLESSNEFFWTQKLTLIKMGGG